MKLLRLLPAAVLAAVCISSSAQTPPPGPYFAVNCVKVKSGKSGEFRRWAQGTLHKYAQARVDSGAIGAWYLLRAVQPAGTENECDYIATYYYPGDPAKPLEDAEMDAALKKAGLGLTVEQYREQQNGLTELATSGIWQQLTLVGSPSQKGDYLVINYNKTTDSDQWAENEKKIWKGMAEELTKAGLNRSWSVNLRVMPNGSGTKYDGVTVDAYPNWDSYIAAGTPNDKLYAIWQKIHPDKTFEQLAQEASKVSTTVMRELWVVQDAIFAQKQISQSGTPR